MRIYFFTALMFLAIGISHVGATRATRPTRGLHLVFDEEFNGSALNTGVWTALNRAGDYGNHESQCYTPENVQVSNGSLVITSSVQELLCGDATHPKTNFFYTSGMVQWTSFAFRYGIVDIRAKTAGGQGSWPAIWLLGANCQASNVLTADNAGACNWPNPGSQETDMIEMDNSVFTNVYHNLFIGSSYFCQQSSTNTSQDWHIYRMTWSPNAITFAIDGTPAGCSFTSGVPATPMFLIINNAMGGLGGNIVNSDFPQTMSIDYVRVYAPQMGS